MHSINQRYREHFGSSNETQPHFERHETLVRFVRTDTCSYIHSLPFEMRCNFVRTQYSCRMYEQFFSYLDFIYCSLGKSDSLLIQVVFILLLALFTFYLIQITGLVTTRFFLPCLKYIAKKFRMSESLAGATIIGIANTAAGLFSEFSDMQANTTTLFNTSYSYAILLQTIIAGLVLTIQPFHIYSPTFVRDSVFFLTLIMYIEYIMGDGTINPYESSFLFLYYTLFLVTVTIDTILVKQLSRDVRRKLRLLEAGAADEKLQRELEILASEGVMEILMKDSRSVVDPNVTRSAFFVGEGANTYIFRQFFESLNPIDEEEWKKLIWIQKFLLCIQVPFYVLFLLVCPRVDFSLRTHGWSKLLNMMQLIIGPLFMMVIARYISQYTIGYSTMGFIFIVATPFTVGTFFTSRTDSPPIYHVAFGVFAACVSAFLVRLLAIEVGSLTYSITIVSQLSPSFVDLTINTWEGGLGSMISSTALVIRGYPRMAFASCYGGPLFSIPIKFGVRLFYRAYVNKKGGGVAVVNRGQFAITLTVFAMGTVLLSLIGVACAKFKGRRSLGILKVVTYLLFLVFVALIEFEVIHGHSTDHTDQRVKYI